MMTNTVRAALVAGVLGTATLGLAGAAVATTAPGTSPCTVGHCYTAQAGRDGAPITIRLVDDEDGGGDMGGDMGGDSSGDFSPAEVTDDVPDTSWAPMDSDEGPGADDPAPADPEPADPGPADPGPADEGQAPDAGDNTPAFDSTGSEPSDSGADASNDPAGDPSDPAADVPTAHEPAQAPEVQVASAPQQDVDAAQASEPTVADPGPADTADVTELRESIESQTSWSSASSSSSWSSQVSTWNSGWVGYDAYYRPMILNPYNSPLQLIYTYDDAPRIVTVGPLQRAVIGASNTGVTSFTTLVKTPTGAVSNVSVGSFTGGGHVPAPGQPPATKPAPLAALKNVLVQLRYSTGTSAPFWVKEIADLGDDPTVGGHKVLIDGATTAWGQWSKTSSGERLFEVSKTEQLPGLTAPSEAPLPGYQNVRLTANTVQSDTWMDVLMWVAIGIGAVGVGTVGAVLIRSRTRNTDREHTV